MLHTLIFFPKINFYDIFLWGTTQFIAAIILQFSCTDLVTHGSKLLTPSALLGALAVAKAPKTRRPRNPLDGQHQQQ